MAWALACPSCRVLLVLASADQRTCPRCSTTYRREGEIWRFLGEDRRAAFREFVEQYETVRAAEGRRMGTPEQLRALPFRDLSGRRPYEWRIRARSYRALVRRVIEPLEWRSTRPLAIADVGSGAGWLAYRLARRGHDVAAFDLVTDGFDGLGAHRHYDRDFLSAQAEFDRLPLVDGSADVVVYDAAFHYAADYARSLGEALRVLAPGGRVAIMDTPFYADPSSGAAMVRERERAFEAQYGFARSGMPTEGFLTPSRLATLAQELGVRWTTFAPWYGVRWWLRPWIARARRRREPARFLLIVGEAGASCGAGAGG